MDTLTAVIGFAALVAIVTLAGPVTLGEREGLRGPGISTGAAASLYGEPAFTAAGGQDNYSAAGAPATTCIVGGSGVCRFSVRG